MPFAKWLIQKARSTPACKFSAGAEKLLHAGIRRRDHPRAPARTSEVDLHDAVAAEDADELAAGAVHEDQHDEPELDGPEMRPHDLAPQVAVRLREVPQPPPDRDEVLEVVHDERRGDVDRRL